jgi:hypothetical protein
MPAFRRTATAPIGWHADVDLDRELCLGVLAEAGAVGGADHARDRSTAGGGREAGAASKKSPAGEGGVEFKSRCAVVGSRLASLTGHQFTGRRCTLLDTAASTANRGAAGRVKPAERRSTPRPASATINNEGGKHEEMPMNSETRQIVAAILAVGLLPKKNFREGAGMPTVEMQIVQVQREFEKLLRIPPP